MNPQKHPPSSVAAPSTGAPTVTELHLRPVFLEASRTNKLIDEKFQDEITVHWKVEPACPDAKLVQAYTVTITRSKAHPALYSLWSLGLQEIDTATVINISNPGQLQVAESDTVPLRKAGVREVVAPAGWRVLDPQNPSLRIVNEAQIWLMEFTGSSFTFKVERYGRAGMTIWSSRVLNCEDDGNGHDNTPPI